MCAFHTSHTIRCFLKPPLILKTHYVGTADQLFQYTDKQPAADPATREALQYRTALAEGFDSLKHRPLSTSTAVAVCQTIKNLALDIRKVPGTKLANAISGEVIYTPPEGETVLREKLSNWEKFLHEQTDLDPLVRLAVAHYQFEAIHPFVDGNGRTGRILNILFLIEAELLTLPILYLSRYIIQHKDDYYRLLLEVTKEQNWEDWILFMLQAIEETAIWTCQKIQAIQRLMEHTMEYVPQELPTIYTHELVDLLFEQPYCRIANLVNTGIAKRQTASEYLKNQVLLVCCMSNRLGVRNCLFIRSLFSY